MTQLLLLSALGVVLAVMGLTAAGATRRGHGVVAALVAGVFFPVTWTAWYVLDEQPYRRSHSTLPR
jgi:hypothetical protein